MSAKIEPKVSQLVRKWEQQVMQLQHRKEQAVAEELVNECVQLELAQQAYLQAIRDLQEAFCHDLMQERIENRLLLASVPDLQDVIDYLNKRGDGT